LAGAAFDKLKVVVIDDNSHMRTLLLSILYAFGFKTLVGEANGKSGFAAVQSIKPDFILTDFSMHPVDGVEFVKMIRACPGPMAWVPIIMITGHGERRYIERARDAGITELLTKPFTPKDLYLRVVEVVERPRPFVKSPLFIGPDRRRKKLALGSITKRRSSDYDVELEFK
jgi:two-component system chemotaxis response regulator CheY